MRPIILEKDENGRIKITVDEIKKIVDDAYNDGFEDAKKINYYPIITTPYFPTPWYSTDHINITCNSTPINTHHIGESVQELL